MLVATKMRNRKRQNNTQSILYFFIVLGQCFGLFPVTGIRDANGILKFSWSCKRTVYAIFSSAIVAVNICLYIIKLINSSEFLAPFVSMVYFVTVFFIDIFFIDLAKKWPALMQKWNEVDRSMVSYTYAYNLDRKLKIIAGIIMVSAAVEHALFVASSPSVIKSNITFIEKIDTYLKGSYEQVFDIVPYNIYLGIFMQVVNIFCTFAWNYMDLFIIVISVALSYRFTQIVRKLEIMFKYKITEEAKWGSVREDYVKLSLLCKSVDKAISNIIILSFANNLFVILIQLMHTILSQTNQRFTQYLYFAYSFSFLIIRTICVCLYAATIDSQSKKPLDILHRLPSWTYNIEIERFITQIKVDQIYLSGRQFFVITNSLVFRIAGAIVTYELILIQIYNTR